MTENKPTILGLQKSFGFGDSLGLATKGHIATIKNTDFAPIFIQQSLQEFERSNKSLHATLESTSEQIKNASFERAWGADANHVESVKQAKIVAKAGFSYFTLDPSSEILDTSSFSTDDIKLCIETFIENSGLSQGDWESFYLKKTWELHSGKTIKFDKETLHLIAAKFANVVPFCEEIVDTIAAHMAERPFEIELALDKLSAPTTAEEHIYLIHELHRHEISIVSFAPLLPGNTNNSIEYKGKISDFEDALSTHINIANMFGPYKISIHRASDKLSIYPAIGRICGNLLHIKTSGGTYLEGLRIICAESPSFFLEILNYALSVHGEVLFEETIIKYSDALQLIKNASTEDAGKLCLDHEIGRHLLSMCSHRSLQYGICKNGQRFQDAITEILEKHSDHYAEIVENYFKQHLDALTAG